MEKIVKRFLSNISIAGNGCWDWSARRSQHGYGWFYYNKKQRIASRVSWELHHGEIPKEMCVCHKCDNPACVNPDHLFLGTHQENMRDRDRKGRNKCGSLPIARGEQHSFSKLKDEDVREIRNLYSQGMLQREIGKRFGIVRQNVSKILLGQRWKHI